VFLLDCASELFADFPLVRDQLLDHWFQLIDCFVDYSLLILFSKFDRVHHGLKFTS